MARDWRLRKGWKSLKSGLFPVPTLFEHITKHRRCLSSKLKKKTQSFKAMLAQESASEKYRKQSVLHDQTAGMPWTSCPGRNNTIGLLYHGSRDFSDYQSCIELLVLWQQCSLWPILHSPDRIQKIGRTQRSRSQSQVMLFLQVKPFINVFFVPAILVWSVLYHIQRFFCHGSVQTGNLVVIVLTRKFCDGDVRISLFIPMPPTIRKNIVRLLVP